LRHKFVGLRHKLRNSGSIGGHDFAGNLEEMAGNDRKWQGIFCSKRKLRKIRQNESIGAWRVWKAWSAASPGGCEFLQRARKAPHAIVDGVRGQGDCAMLGNLV
jgi:hypothetical protein